MVMPYYGIWVDDQSPKHYPENAFDFGGMQDLPPQHVPVKFFDGTWWWEMVEGVPKCWFSIGGSLLPGHFEERVGW